jgi:transcriptional regulator with XRE-family HTH domain
MVNPPAASIARLKGSFLAMQNSSTALVRSQATLHCGAKDVLYTLDMTLGKRIRLARKRLGMTQLQLAYHFGVTNQAVSSWERDEHPPEGDKISLLRKVLRVTFAWLLGGEGEPPSPNDPIVRAEDLQMELYENQRALEEARKRG